MREYEVHGLAVGQGCVHRLAGIADLDQLAVERLRPDEVVLDALRDPLLVLGCGEHCDQSPDEVLELPEFVAVARVGALIGVAETVRRATKQASDREVHGDVEDDDDARERQEKQHARREGRGADRQPEGEEDGGKRDGDERRRLELAGQSGRATGS